MWWLLLWLLIFPAPIQTQASAAAKAARPADSKVWVGRYAEYEEFLRTAPIEREEGIGIGVTGPRRAFFAAPGLAESATVKRLPPSRRSGFYESYKSEIAAYKLDRILQLDMVPPTVERRVGNDVASIQLWVEGTRMLKDVQAQKLRAPDPEAWNRQLHRVQVFDDLVGNIDANAGNLLFDPAWNFIKVDHSRCFTSTQKLPFKLSRIDQPFYDRVKALTADGLREELGDLMDARAVLAVLDRRDEIVKTFEKLAKQHGAAAVFEPWPDR
jgi:hypothetical protein